LRSDIVKLRTITSIQNANYTISTIIISRTTI
jgi:hypothetical protein